jgi:uncharacterized membrane protein
MAETEDEINDYEWGRLENWSGWFGSYSSARDTRLWVPKRPMTGEGFTLNCGHPGAKTVLIGFCIVPAALVLTGILLFVTR